MQHITDLKTNAVKSVFQVALFGGIGMLEFVARAVTGLAQINRLA